MALSLRLLALVGAVLVTAGFALSPWPWLALVGAGVQLIAAAILTAEEAL